MTICSAIQHLKHPKCNVDLSMHHAHSAPLFLFAVCCYYIARRPAASLLFTVADEAGVCCVLLNGASSSFSNYRHFSSHLVVWASTFLSDGNELDFIPQKSNANGTNRFLEELVCFGPLLKSQFDSKLESLKRLTSAGVCLEIYGP